MVPDVKVLRAVYSVPYALERLISTSGHWLEADWPQKLLEDELHVGTCGRETLSRENRMCDNANRFLFLWYAARLRPSLPTTISTASTSCITTVPHLSSISV